MGRTKSKRRRNADSRREKPSILIVVQGEVTEVQYFRMLKQKYRISYLTVHTESHSPEKLVAKSRQYMTQDKDAPYSFVFFVIDVDETKKHQFEQAFSQARNACTRQTTYAFVVSNECFETWLLAHFENIRTRDIPRANLPGMLIQLGAVLPAKPKHLADGFPVEQYKQAAKNCNHADLNELGPTSSTTMPSLLEALNIK